jgi:translation initiation factor IF-2
MFDDRGRAITEAGPSTPVEILGLEGMPDAGDTFLVMADRDKAKGIAQYRKMKEREAQLAKSSRVSLEGLAEQIKQAGVKDLNLILKGDVQGSVEVLADSLQRMSTEKVRVKVLHSGVGAITEATCCWLRPRTPSSSASTCGPSARPPSSPSRRTSRSVCTRSSTSCRTRSPRPCYGLLDPVFKENYAGRAEVLNVFKITKVGRSPAAASPTASSARRRGRLMRDGAEVFKGKISSLKRFKDDVSRSHQRHGVRHRSRLFLLVVIWIRRYPSRASACGVYPRLYWLRSSS